MDVYILKLTAKQFNLDIEVVNLKFLLIMSVRKSRKTKVGVVVSDATQKTCVVKVITQVKHPKFRKYIKQSKKYHVHDENNECKQGDLVKIAETRPLSKQKRWRLLDIQNKQISAE